MPVSATSKSLMAIATDSSLSVYSRIKIIKGEDKRISSNDEAQAILAIPNDEVTWLEDKNQLPFAKMDAQNFLKYGNRCLRDDIADLYKYCKKQGNNFLTKVSEWMNPHSSTVASNEH